MLPNKLAKGLKIETVYTVTEDMSPPHLTGVLSTPSLIGLMEDTCLEALEPCLDTGHTTVGTQVNVSHVGAAYQGEEVTVRVHLVKVTRQRLLTFEVEISAAGGVISSGTHQRMVVARSQLREGR